MEQLTNSFWGALAVSLFSIAAIVSFFVAYSIFYILVAITVVALVYFYYSLSNEEKAKSATKQSKNKK